VNSSLRRKARRVSDLADLRDQLKTDEKDLIEAQTALKKATSSETEDLKASIYDLQQDVEAGREEIESSEETILSMQDELIYLFQSGIERKIASK
jgi:outer membrane murein-binding lipoprotein Lpp